jgi:hypothetical protein
VFFSDLSEYSYSENRVGDGVLSIGWLDELHPFQQGAMPRRLVKRLLSHYSERIHQTRGFHPCPFCSDPQHKPSIRIKGRTLRLGSSEVWIRGDCGKTYACPDLLIHYILEHHYLPPREFLEAL